MARNDIAVLIDPDGEWLVQAYLSASECFVDNHVALAPVNLSLEDVAFLRRVRDLAQEVEVARVRKIDGPVVEVPV